MHFGEEPAIFEKAEELMARMTPAEEKLWNSIKINDWHLKFRRQHPLAHYIADFYCHSVKLVIELDGGYHENQEVKIYDDARENEIKQLGVTVLRFKNEEVINNIKLVLSKISEVIASIKKPSPKKAGSLHNSPLGDGGKDVGKDGGKTLFVIKIGGNIIDDPIALLSFLQDFASINAKKILVHGGGKIATKIGEQLGIQPEYINGRRITDASTIDLVTMVYGGLINKKIVAQLQSLDCNAIGLTGADANIIPAVKRQVKDIDYGFVGDLNSTELGVRSLELFVENGLCPVLAPLTHDGEGQLLNTNADTIASSVAAGLAKKYAVRLIYCFEKRGILENMEEETSVIPLVTKNSYQVLLSENKLFDGILPKIDNAFAAIDNGVQEVLIGHAGDLLKNVTGNTIGTIIKASDSLELK